MNVVSWQAQARCRRQNPDFYTERPGDLDDHRAKSFCALCKVWAPCLAVGMAEEYGIWGGLNMPERSLLRRIRVAPDAARAKDIKRLVNAMGRERLVEALSDRSLGGEALDVSRAAALVGYEQSEEFHEELAAC